MAKLSALIVAVVTEWVSGGDIMKKGSRGRKTNHKFFTLIPVIESETKQKRYSKKVCVDEDRNDTK